MSLPVVRTVKGFCEAYGVSRATAYRLLDAGKLTAVKAGSRTLIREDSAQAWLAGLQTYEKGVQKPQAHEGGYGRG